MAFKKGNNLGGRKKGSKTKVNQDIRKAFQLLLEENIEQLKDDFSAITEPEKRIKLLLDLTQYCLPKLRSVEVEQEQPEPEPKEMTEEQIQKVIEKYMKMY